MEKAIVCMVIGVLLIGVGKWLMRANRKTDEIIGFDEDVDRVDGMDFVGTDSHGEVEACTMAFTKKWGLDERKPGMYIVTHYDGDWDYTIACFKKKEWAEAWIDKNAKGADLIYSTKYVAE